MNLVVTGATSFLGTALIRELLRQGHQIYAVVRPNSQNLAALTKTLAEADSCGREHVLHILELELGQLDKISSVIKDPCDMFFHLGWDGSGSNSRTKADLQKKNVEDAVKALWGARSLCCRRFVFSGSQAEYGMYHTAAREDMDCRPMSEYGKAKAEFGRRLQEICRTWEIQDNFKMEYFHVRIFSVYGPGDHPWSLVNTCLDTFLKGGRIELGACTQQWNYIYIEDLVKGLIALAFSETDGEASQENGIYNLAGSMDATRPLREYVEEMHRLCRGRGSYVYGKRPPNAEGAVNLIPDIRKIQARTGWKPEISFDQGIKRMLESYESKA